MQCESTYSGTWSFSSSSVDGKADIQSEDFPVSLQLTARELSSLGHFNTFVLKIYLKAWFTCACASSAPQNDLQLLCELESYKESHEAVAKAAMKSFSGHLRYLSEILVCLAFFDSAVSAELKSAMVTALDNKTTDHPRCIAFVMDFN